MVVDDIALRHFFDWVDQDSDGFITIEEIKQACSVDIDGDGNVIESEKIWSARGWLERFPFQDLDLNQQISFEELLAHNFA